MVGVKSGSELFIVVPCMSLVLFELVVSMVSVGVGKIGFLEYHLPNNSGNTPYL